MKFTLKYSLIAAIALSGCAPRARVALPVVPLTGLELGRAVSPGDGDRAAITAMLTAVKAADSKDDIITRYGQIIAACTRVTQDYAIAQADAADKQKLVKTVVGSLTGAFAGAAGAVSAAADSKAAGWSSLAFGVGGAIATYVVSPGEEGIRARNTKMQSITAGMNNIRSFFQTQGGTPPENWPTNTSAEFVGLLHDLVGRCTPEARLLSDI